MDRVVLRYRPDRRLLGRGRMGSPAAPVGCAAAGHVPEQSRAAPLSRAAPAPGPPRAAGRRPWTTEPHGGSAHAETVLPGLLQRYARRRDGGTPFACFRNEHWDSEGRMQSCALAMHRRGGPGMAPPARPGHGGRDPWLVHMAPPLSSADGDSAAGALTAKSQPRCEDASEVGRSCHHSEPEQQANAAVRVSSLPSILTATTTCPPIPDAYAPTTSPSAVPRPQGTRTWVPASGSVLTSGLLTRVMLRTLFLRCASTTRSMPSASPSRALDSAVVNAGER